MITIDKTLSTDGETFEPDAEERERIGKQIFEGISKLTPSGKIVCPVCQSDRVGIINDPPVGIHRPTPALFYAGTSYLGSRYAKLYLLMCQNCTYLMPFALSPLLERVGEDGG